MESAVRGNPDIRRAVLAILVATAVSAATGTTPASAGFLDFLFGNSNTSRSKAQTNPFADPFGLNPAPAPLPRTDVGDRTGYCVRSCDGRYFPVQARGDTSPAQVCQSFCPAAATKVYFGNSIDGATAASGERYADSENAFVFRKVLKADCTCNGRDSAGLAPVDLSLDTTLRPGDIIATSNGLLAYSGSHAGDSQTAEFTPVASYPGLTADVRAKLGEMKVAPVKTDFTEDQTPLPSSMMPPAATLVPKTPSTTSSTRAKRAELD
jgi:hypothetical protein